MADVALTPADLRTDPSVIAVGFSEPAAGDKLRCTLCPRQCTLRDGQRGLCYVRGRIGDTLVLTTWGRSSGFCIDPIEKKPLNHFLPGSPVLSFGTAGCNLSCSFCQNWDISKSREMDTLAAVASPNAIADAAVQSGCRSVAFTYNDPVIFHEYAKEVAAAVRAVGLQTVAVTAGYVSDDAREAVFASYDAVNVDLKAFTEDFYRRQTGGHLAPVLETLKWLQTTDIWVEITTLLIPGLNDGDAEVTALSRWVRDHMGTDVPLHFSAFHPDYKLTHLPRTQLATLQRARAIAIAEGLRFVYTGNAHDLQGDTTCCSGCGKPVIIRDWYALQAYDLGPNGECVSCGTRIPGVFARSPGNWGRRRLPIRIAE
ncbi:MAG: AmmeMemoRadiSam system radical SAM enzyme [Myxococcales bacterium]|nr:AmmeMemoRadiSam system radical SAM enzyme [Myxococcales bacterium]